jgi:hypothetical protein
VQQISQIPPSPTTTHTRLIYVAEGEDALGNNHTLTAADKAALAGKTLQQVWLEMKAAGKAFSSGMSRFRGVGFDKRLQKWRATVSVKALGSKVTLGRWLIEEEAAHAYDAAARRIYGR